MGCITSSEEEPKMPKIKLSLREREKRARANRKGAKSLAHNLVHEQFGR